MSHSKGDRVRLTLRVPVDDLAHLRKLARCNGFEINELICYMIAHALQKIDPTYESRQDRPT